MRNYPRRTTTYRGAPTMRRTHDAAMCARRRAGATYAEIAREFRCSTSHAHRITRDGYRQKAQ